MNATKHARVNFRGLKRGAWFAIALFLCVSARSESLRRQIESSLANLPHPTNTAAFHTAPALSCLNQGESSICWSFATSSFVEAEMARLRLEPVRLSVLYPLYCGYLEKTRRFVRNHGDSRFDPGDLFTGVPELWQKFGAMPAATYDHFTEAQPLDQNRLYDELDDLMAEIKRNNRWNEADAVARAAKILNRHLGEPPKKFTFNGATYTPLSFLKEIVRLPWTEYVMVTSFQNGPFNSFIELKVPDNWRHLTNFFNVPLPLYYDSLKRAVRGGYTAAVSIDTSEPSCRITDRYCFIPDFDIAPVKIDQQARELRFLDGATTDDHAIHLIGWNESGGEDWFLAKDSAKSAWRNGNRGEIFIHSSYVKLKVLAFLVHRDAVPELTALMPRK